jgi:transposase InsO family protein
VTPRSSSSTSVKADSLDRNTKLQENTASALAAYTKKTDKVKGAKTTKRCKLHGPGHSDEQCRAQKAAKDSANTADTTSSSSGLTTEEKALMATIGHIKTPLVRHLRRSRHRKRTTNDPWNPDSGATKHMTSHLKWLRNIVSVKVPVRLANNEVVWATKMGSVCFQPLVNGRTGRTIVINNVLYVPDLQNNLFSVLSVVRDSKMRVVIEGEQMRFYDKTRSLILTATISGTTGSLDGYTLDNDVEEAFLTNHVDRNILHQRLGHIGKDRFRTLLTKNLANGIVVTPGSQIVDTCEPCIAGKQHRDPFPHIASNRSTTLLGRIHSDVHGPLQTQTPGGYLYWVTFIDDYSRFKEVRLIKKKSDVFDEFKKFVAKVERQTGKQVKELRDDKGGEYIGTEFGNWCDERGITRQHTVRATPQQNGVAERLNGALQEGVIAMLTQACLPPSFWGAAVLYLTAILNATPSSAVSDTTSYAVWHGRSTSHSPTIPVPVQLDVQWISTGFPLDKNWILGNLAGK